LGTLNFHRSVSQPVSPLQPSLGEMVQEEVMRATLKERPATWVSMQEKTVKIPVQVEAAAADCGRT
jgi:hypothetical protein